MTCEWAEGQLSAYLDSTLDPPVRAEVSVHLESCEQCRVILADYRRNDTLLASAPRYSPPDSLRERIFSSPEYAAILRESRRDAERLERHSPATHARPTSAHTPLGPRWRAPSASQVIVSSTSSDTPSGATVAPAAVTDTSQSTPQTKQSLRAAQPSASKPTRAWSRVWLPIAAMVAIALGLSLLFHQGVSPLKRTSPSTGRITAPLAGPNFSTTPLAAGNRLVFAHDGALWSIAEVGPQGVAGDEARLTPIGVSVVAWSVMPITNGRGGEQIAYIDGATGTLHLVRSDRQADHTLATVAPASAGQSFSASFWGSATGQVIRAGLSWSPDGAHLAYVSASTGTRGATLTLHVLDLTTGAIAQKQFDHTLTSGPVTDIAWSVASDWLAYAQASSVQGNPGVWLYSVASGQTHQLATQADPLASGSSSVSVARLAIIPGAPGQAATSVTWATSVGAAITGVFVQQFTAASPLRLTPAATHFTAADVSVSGRWLLGDGATLVSVTPPTDAALTPTLTPIATVAAPIVQIIWSPGGAEAVIQMQGALSFWNASGIVSMANSFVGTLPVWSADGSALAYQAGAVIVSEQIRGGRVSAMTTMAQARAGQAALLQWAPDGNALGIASATGVSVATPKTNTVLDRHMVSGSALAWSIAG